MPEPFDQPRPYESLRVELPGDVHAAMRATVRAELARLRVEPHALADQPVTEVNPMSPATAPRRRPLLLAAACVVLVAAGVTALVAVTRNGEDPPADVGRADGTDPTDVTKPGSTAAASTSSPATAPATSPPAPPAPPTSNESDASSDQVLDHLPSPVPIESAADGVVELPYDGAYLGATDDSIWVTDLFGGSLDRRVLPDLDSGGVVGGAQPSLTPQIARPAAGFGSIWTVFPDHLVRIDIDTMTITAEIPVSGSTTQPDSGFLSDLAVGPTGVWVLSHDASGSYATRVDPTSDAVADRFIVDGNARSLAYGGDSLWITLTGDQPQLLELDPATGAERARIDLSIRPGVVAVTDQAVWVLGVTRRDSSTRPARWTVSIVDPNLGQEASTVDVYAEASTTLFVSYTDLVARGGSAWVPTPTGLAQIDAQGKVVAVYSGVGDGGVTTTDDAVWFVDKLDRKLYRIPFGN